MSFSVASVSSPDRSSGTRRPAPGRSAVPYRYADGFSRRGITDFPLFASLQDRTRHSSGAVIYYACKREIIMCRETEPSSATRS